MQERIEHLEATVSELQETVKKMEAAAGKVREKRTDSLPQGPEVNQTEVDAGMGESFQQEKSRGAKFFELPESIRSGEFWLNKLGIALVLFGIAFLFKYSIDQGWLTPWVRVFFGVAAGVGLILSGLRITSRRRHFSQVLVGGGIAAFYITGFAAFQILHIISHPVAFIFMVFVTLLAFILSIRQEGAVLSLIGVIGGLGTPFLLYTGAGNLPALVGYTCLVAGGSCAIFFFRRWRSLLWTTVTGGWLVFLVALINARSAGPISGTGDRWALQLGILFCWLTFWGLPMAREFLRIRNPYSGKEPEKISERRITRYRYLHVLVISTPVIALSMSMEIWSLSDYTWGWIAMLAAIIYGIVSWGLSRQKLIGYLSDTHALVAAAFLTFSFYLLLHGDLLLFTLAVEAVALHILAHRLNDRRIKAAAHLLFGIVGLWLGWRLFVGQVEGRFILNVQAVTDLWVIVLASLITIFYLTGDEKKTYFLFIHLAILGWFLRELSSIPNGQGYVTIAWGLYSVVLLILGLRMNDKWMRVTAMVTLFIVVGKLFLVDLAQLETIWRILLFLGFGGVFLTVSYYFRSLWKQKYESSSKPHPE